MLHQYTFHQPSQHKNIYITFVQCWTNLEAVGPELYKCFVFTGNGPFSYQSDLFNMFNGGMAFRLYWKKPKTNISIEQVERELYESMNTDFINSYWYKYPAKNIKPLYNIYTTSAQRLHLAKCDIQDFFKARKIHCFSTNKSIYFNDFQGLENKGLKVNAFQGSVRTREWRVWIKRDNTHLAQSIFLLLQGGTIGVRLR